MDYQEWLANIEPVPKKDGKLQPCMDYKDSSKAIPKDVSLLYIDVIVGDIAGHAMSSLMDVFLGYNKIKMAAEDRKKTSFITQWGRFSYKLMPLGLKNAGTT